MRGPWQAIPSRMLPNLKKTCKLPFEIADLAVISIAGRTRSALVTANTFINARSELVQTLQGNERVLNVLEQRWVKSSLITNAEEAISICNNSAHDIIHKCTRCDTKRLFNLQSKLTAALHHTGNFDELEDVLIRRMKGWIKKDDPEYPLISPCAKEVAEKCRWLAGKIKPCVTFSVLKWLNNALCTTARFQKEPISCLLCGLEKGDHIDHLISCPSFVEFARSFWRISLEIDRRSLCMLSFPGVPITGDILGMVAVHLYACLKMYNAARAGTKGNAAYYRMTCVKLAGMCPFSRNIINTYRGFDPRPAPASQGDA